MPSESLIFTTHVDPISPPINGGGAGYRPRVRLSSNQTFIAIAEKQQLYIKLNFKKIKP